MFYLRREILRLLFVCSSGGYRRRTHYRFARATHPRRVICLIWLRPDMLVAVVSAIVSATLLCGHNLQVLVLSPRPNPCLL